MPSSQVRLEETYQSVGCWATSAASAAVADAVSSGCSIPRSPAYPQHPQATGTTTFSAAASAIAARSSAEPRRVDEQVGGTVTDAARSPTSGRPSWWRHTKVTASTASGPAASIAPTVPPVQRAGSRITGGAPTREASSSAARTRWRIRSSAPVTPFEEKGVPQRGEAASSGTARRAPARWASRFREAGAPLAAGGGSSPVPTGSVDVVGSVGELGAPTGTETSNDGFAAAGASPRAADMAARAFAPLPPPLRPQLPPHPPRGSSAAPNMVCTQAGRYTARVSALARPRPPGRRTEPPERGSSL